jgi:hypothetical protein
MRFRAELMISRSLGPRYRRRAYSDCRTATPAVRSKAWPGANHRGDRMRYSPVFDIWSEFAHGLPRVRGEGSAREARSEWHATLTAM